MFTDAEKMLVV